MNNQTNFSLEERAKGHGPAIGTDELLDLLAELDAWRFAAERCGTGIETPEQMENEFFELEQRPLCIDEDHANYELLDRFYRDCQDLIGYANAWASDEENIKYMIEELHEMNRQLGVE
jgi:hypothetical protein